MIRQTVFGVKVQDEIGVGGGGRMKEGEGRLLPVLVLMNPVKAVKITSTDKERAKNRFTVYS